MPARSGQKVGPLPALVVDGRIYHHQFVAQAVIDGLMRAGLDTGVPVLSVSLTPHRYRETPHYAEIFRAHFRDQGSRSGRGDPDDRAPASQPDRTTARDCLPSHREAVAKSLDLEQQRPVVRNLGLFDDLEGENLDCLVHQHIVGIAARLLVMRRPRVGVAAADHEVL